MKLKVYPKSPAPRHIEQIVEVLRNGGVIVMPTDSVYAFACASNQKSAIDRLAKLKGTKTAKQSFSFNLADLTNLAEYTKHVSTDAYRIMNRVLPGPFTFILNASKSVEKLIPGKKTIGIRVQQNNIPSKIIELLGTPLLTCSVHDDDEIKIHATDPHVIHQKWEKKVDLVIDGGIGNIDASTIVDCTTDEMVILRQGIGELDEAIAE